MSNSLPGGYDTSACMDAIGLALRALEDHDFSDGPFRLVSAVNLLKGHAPPAGPFIWELRFKPLRLIPGSDETEVGAGGDVVVRINLASQASDAVRVSRDD